MGKVILYTVLCILGNVLLMLLLGFIAQNFFSSERQYDLRGLFFGLVTFAISLLVQLIVGGILASKPRTKQIGQGLLLSASLILLIGLAVCTRSWY